MVFVVIVGCGMYQLGWEKGFAVGQGDWVDGFRAGVMAEKVSNINSMMIPHPKDPNKATASKYSRMEKVSGKQTEFMKALDMVVSARAENRSSVAAAHGLNYVLDAWIDELMAKEIEMADEPNGVIDWTGWKEVEGGVIPENPASIIDVRMDDDGKVYYREPKSKPYRIEHKRTVVEDTEDYGRVESV